MRPFLKGLLLGVVLSLLAVTAYGTLRYAYRMRLPAELTVDHALQPIEVPQDWIKSGKPRFLYTEYVASPDRSSSSGIWSCEGPTTFEWRFDADETVHVLDGRVEITYQGQHFVLESGDTAFFQADTRATWNVPKYMRKSFTLHQPNAMVRLVRSLLRAIGPEAAPR